MGVVQKGVSKKPMITTSEFTELAKSRFLDCDSCGMTQGALIRNVADCQAL